jgi:hypothetical protein
LTFGSGRRPNPAPRSNRLIAGRRRRKHNDRFTHGIRSPFLSRAGRCRRGQLEIRSCFCRRAAGENAKACATLRFTVASARLLSEQPCSGVVLRYGQKVSQATQAPSGAREGKSKALRTRRQDPGADRSRARSQPSRSQPRQRTEDRRHRTFLPQPPRHLDRQRREDRWLTPSAIFQALPALPLGRISWSRRAQRCRKGPALDSAAFPMLALRPPFFPDALARSRARDALDRPHRRTHRPRSHWDHRQ